jgi:hypothetical protein
MNAARLLSIATLTLVLADGSLRAAEAPPTKEECRGAYVRGQQEHKAGKLLASRDDFVICAGTACPAVYRPECAKWLDEVGKQIPSVVCEVVDASGASLTDAKLFVDGALVKTRLDGKSIELEAGEHVFRFEIAGKPPLEKKMLIVEGEKSRKIAVTLDKAPISEEKPKSTPGPAEHASSAPVAGYVLLGVSAVALGSFAYFGLSGISARKDLQECTPHCDPADLDTTRRRFLIADLSLAVGALALGVGGYLVLSHPSSTEKPAVARLFVAPSTRGVTLAANIEF